MEKEKYDILIIGSGIGGLTAGIILARFGYKVLILEKNQQVGGALQVFSRDKCIFDTGVHYLGGLDEGENLFKIFSYLGILEELEFQKMDEEGFDHIRFSDGFVGKLGMGYTNFKASLLKDFPLEEEGIDRLIEHIKKTITFFPLYDLKVEENYQDNIQEVINSELTWDYMKSIFKEERIIHVILGNAMIYAGDLKRTPFYVFALIVNSYIKGSYRLPGGGGLLIKALVKQFRYYGGEIQKHKEVTKINILENNAHSVTCKDGSTYEASRFISNLHPSITVKLVGESHFKPAYRNRIAKMKNTVSSFSVFLSLEKNKVPYLNYNMYELYGENPFNTVDYKKEDWPNYIMVTTNKHHKEAEFADTIILLQYMNAEETAEWDVTHNTIPSPSLREVAYQKWKKEKEQQVIQRFLERYPEVEEHIRSSYSSSPLTYRDYLGTPEGELYGVEKDVNHTLSTMFNTRTRIPNLFLTGQNIVFHGVLGSCIGSLLTCFNIISKKELLDQLNNENGL